MLQSLRPLLFCTFISPGEYLNFFLFYFQNEKSRSSHCFYRLPIFFFFTLFFLPFFFFLVLLENALQNLHCGGIIVTRQVLMQKRPSQPPLRWYTCRTASSHSKTPFRTSIVMVYLSHGKFSFENALQNLHCDGILVARQVLIRKRPSEPPL